LAHLWRQPTAEIASATAAKTIRLNIANVPVRRGKLYHNLFALSAGVAHRKRSGVSSDGRPAPIRYNRAPSKFD
jgi:hypothetical protein